MFAISSLSVGLPALAHALFNLSAVTLVVIFFPTVFALFAIALPAFLIASIGPSVSTTAGDWSHHSIIVSI